MSNSNQQPPPILETPPQRVGQSAKGQYKFEVRDADGVVYDSGDWKPNLILDCGLDKLADMPWAQTFQWSVVGTNPAPTVEKEEDTQLRVNLDLLTKCPNPESGFHYPDGERLRCFEPEETPIRVKAAYGCREAPITPTWIDPTTGKEQPNVPLAASDHNRTFGRLTEIGSTLYLRDRNLQFKVLTSCPQYTVDPIHATASVLAVSGQCSTLTGLSALSGDLADYDGDGSFTFKDRGLVATPSHKIGQGYVRTTGAGLIGMTLFPGDPTQPLLLPGGGRNPASGIKVDFPTGRAAKATCQVAGKDWTTGVVLSDITLTDTGDGYGDMPTCDAQPVTLTIDAPVRNAHLGPWEDDYHLTWGKAMVGGTAGGNYPGMLNHYGEPLKKWVARNQYNDNDLRIHRSQRHSTKWMVKEGAHWAAGPWPWWIPSTKWSSNSEYPEKYFRSFDKLDQDIMEHVYGDGTGTAKNRGWGANATDYDLLIAQIMMLHWIPQTDSSGHYWLSQPGGATYDASIEMVGTWVWPTSNTLASNRWSTNFNYLRDSVSNKIHVLTDNSEMSRVGAANGNKSIGSADNAAINDDLADIIKTQCSTAALLKAAIINNEFSFLDIKEALDQMTGSTVTMPISTFRNFAYRPGQNSGISNNHMKLVETWSLINGANSIGHFEPNTTYQFKTPDGGADRVGQLFGYATVGNTVTDADWASADIFGGLFYPISNWSGGGADIDSFALVTNGVGVVDSIQLTPKTILQNIINSANNSGRASGILGRKALADDTQARAYIQSFLSTNMTKAPNFPPRQAAEGVATTSSCKVGNLANITITKPGRGYTINDTPAVAFTGPKTSRAQIAATTTETGSITGFTVLDAGEGYSCTEPVVIHFPEPPPQEVRAWDLLVKPVMTYENINNDYMYKQVGIGAFHEEKCDIYHTQQTYLGQGKNDFDLGTVTNGPLDGGYASQPELRTGPCHYVDMHKGKGTEIPQFNQPNGGTNPNPLTYKLEDPLDFESTKLDVDPVTHNQYKTHGWYVTGVNHETNSQYCGTDFLSSGNQVSMVRTFDFYMELQPVTYTEIGFKEAPAARELFSRIVFDDPIRLRAGQYLRIAYQLLVTMEPGPTARYREVPTEGTWTNGYRTRKDANTLDTTVVPILSGYECIQGNGIAIVDELGVAIPYDITGFANEPYAPGSYMLGPQYGYVNRWKNGDSRLSFPTREYNNDINNPWILGGDQHNPPDWAIKFFDSPTGNYRPREFKSYIEWPGYTTKIVNYRQYTPDRTKLWSQEVSFPPGPEVTFERDAFAHWFTPTFPEQPGANPITWTQYVPHLSGGKEGRWDYHVTKPYVREVYPHLMDDKDVKPFKAIPDSWIEKYKFGDLLADNGLNLIRSGKGVWMEPVIEFDGDMGGLHDPTTISTVNKNPLSMTGGMGMITRASFLARNPYTMKILTMLHPHNNGGIGSTGNPVWHVRYKCNTTGTGPMPSDYYSNYGSPNGSVWCYHTSISPISEDRAFGPLGLVERQTDIYMSNMNPNEPGTGGTGQGSGPFVLNHQTQRLSNLYPIDASYGGGFSTLDSWKTWTHTPLLDHTTGNNNSMLVNPDTAGNWAAAEAIPVAGASAFISNANRSFHTIGGQYNLSHTLYGAVCGAGGKPEHDFDMTKSPLSPLPIEQQVGTGGNPDDGPSRCFETPLYLNDYKRGDFRREKYGEFETSFGNLTAVKCIGVGPTSTTLMPIDMTDAARFNTYVFKFGNAPDFPESFHNLTTFKLKTTFQHTWYRDLT